MTDHSGHPVDELGVATWETLLRVHADVVPVVAREVQEATGLPLAWYDVLLELNRAPRRRLRMRQLGERVVLSRTRVSRIVDDLVADGLVTREADPADARAMFAVITTDGRQVLRRAAPVYLRAIEQHFAARLERAELEAVHRGLRRVLDDAATPHDRS